MVLHTIKNYCAAICLLATLVFTRPSFADPIEDTLSNYQNYVIPSKSTTTAIDSLPLRFRLHLTPISKIQGVEKNGQRVTKLIATKHLNNTLRASLKETNHFYIDVYHIQTEPFERQGIEKRVRLKVAIFSRYGSEGNIEEPLGSFNISSYVEKTKGPSPFLIWQEASQKIFKNKVGEAILKVKVDSP